MEKKQQTIDHFILKRALLFSDTECGDTGILEFYDDICFAALVDALGHGQNAFQIAQIAEKYLRSCYKNDLKTIMNGLHNCLKETRGAVAAICKLNTTTYQLSFVGVGNISARIIGSNSLRLLSSDGILGYIISTPKERVYQLNPKDTIILHSDGISEHFSHEDFPSISTMQAQEFGIELMNRFGKENDDRSCVIIKITE